MRTPLFINLLNTRSTEEFESVGFIGYAVEEVSIISFGAETFRHQQAPPRAPSTIHPLPLLGVLFFATALHGDLRFTEQRPSLTAFKDAVQCSPKVRPERQRPRDSQSAARLAASRAARATNNCRLVGIDRFFPPLLTHDSRQGDEDSCDFSLLVDLRQMAATAASSASSCLARGRRCEQTPLLLLHLKHPFVRDLVVGRPLQLQVRRLQRSITQMVAGRAVAVRAVGVGMKLQGIVGTWTGRPAEAPVPALEKIENGDWIRCWVSPCVRWNDGRRKPFLNRLHQLRRTGPQLIQSQQAATQSAQLPLQQHDDDDEPQPQAQPSLFLSQQHDDQSQQQHTRQWLVRDSTQLYIVRACCGGWWRETARTSWSRLLLRDENSPTLSQRPTTSSKQ
jgi:hypothetical protein